MKKESATLSRNKNLDDLLLFKASYHRFQFSKHTHDEFALGLMEKGVQKVHCRGTDYCAPVGSLITVNVDEVHDGMSADCDEFRYRVIYLPFELLQKIGKEMVGPKSSYYFRLPVTTDPELAKQLSYIFYLLDLQKPEVLEIQSVFYTLVADLLTRHGVEHSEIADSAHVPVAVDRACTFINDMALHNISLDEIASAAGLSRFHFLRVFTSSQGISPYSYLLHRRLQLAKSAIHKGTPLSDVAYQARFSDQSHFTRRFKAAYGITPKQYQKAVC